MSLSRKLREIRKANNLTMEELAERFNKKYGTTISKSTISRWESGQVEPTNSYISLYAKEFAADMNYLYSVGKYEDKPTYHINQETIKLAQELHNNPRLEVLMSSSRKTTPDELEALIKIVEGMTQDD